MGQQGKADTPGIVSFPGPWLSANRGRLLRHQRVARPIAGRFRVTPQPLAGATVPSLNGPLIGRTVELQALAELLEHPRGRLITLVGPGGVGKTALGIAAAHRARETFRDRVWFVPLAAISDAGLILAAIASTLDIRNIEDSPLLHLIGNALGDLPCLVVLDNFEQFTDGARTVEQLLAALPRLHLMITSRSPLQVCPEQVVQVPCLATDLDARGQRLAHGLPGSAVELFVDRARASNPAFPAERVDAEVETLERICKRLDGLPLAIQLVASWTKLYTPRELLEKLDHPMRMLRNGPHDLPPRQQSMSETIGWSYRLLTDTEQRMFRKLSVFRGGFQRSAFAIATATDGPGTDDQDELTLLSLVDKQLVQRTGGEDGEYRFGMLETVREYAGEVLGGDPDEEWCAREAHATWYLALAERIEAGWQLKGTGVGLDQLGLEHDNLRAALRWFDQTRNADGLLRLSISLCSFWYHHGHLREADAWLTRATILGHEAVASVYLRSMVLSWHGRLVVFLGEPARARMLLEEALALRRTDGNREGIAFTQMHFGRLLAAEGGDDPAPALEEAHRLFVEIGHQDGIAMSLDALSDVAFQRGDYGRAEMLAQQALAAAEQAGNALRTTVSLVTLAQVATKRNKPGEAVALLSRSLDISHTIGFRFGIADALVGLAATLHAAAHALPAIRLLAAASVIQDGLASRLHFHETQFRKTLADAPSWLPGNQFGPAWEAGLRLSLDEAVAEARNVIGAIGEPAPQNPAAAFNLSARECDVLALLVHGRSNAGIAGALGISRRTVAVHVSRILQKLGVSNRAAAVSAAIRHGLAPAGVDEEPRG